MDRGQNRPHSPNRHLNGRPAYKRRHSNGQRVFLSLRIVTIIKPEYRNVDDVVH